MTVAILITLVVDMIAQWVRHEREAIARERLEREVNSLENILVKKGILTLDDSLELAGEV